MIFSGVYHSRLKMLIVDTLLALTGLNGWIPALLSMALLSRRSNSSSWALFDPPLIIKDLRLTASFPFVATAPDVHWLRRTCLMIFSTTEVHGCPVRELADLAVG